MDQLDERKRVEGRRLKNQRRETEVALQHYTSEMEETLASGMKGLRARASRAAHDGENATTVYHTTMRRLLVQLNQARRSLQSLIA